MPLVITPQGLLSDTPLTIRERNILQLLANGRQQKQIAEELAISHETIKAHLRRAYKKLGVHNTIQALLKAGMI